MTAGEVVIALVAIAIVTGVLTGFSSPWLTEYRGGRQRTPGNKSRRPIERDPVGYLRKNGTPADAERLREQGINLTGLGYDPPGE